MRARAASRLWAISDLIPAHKTLSKQMINIIVTLIMLFCSSLPLMGADKKPLTKEESAKVIEAAIREDLEKPTGELTKADLEKVTDLHLFNYQLTNVKGLEKLTKLPSVSLRANLNLTKAQIDELQKALPKCKIYR